MTPERIRALVALHYEFRVSQLTGPSRYRSIVRARMVAMWLTRRLVDPEPSYPEIGVFYGGRDHSTVIHAVNKIQTLVDAGRLDADELFAIVTGAPVGTAEAA